MSCATRPLATRMRVRAGAPRVDHSVSGADTGSGRVDSFSLAEVLALANGCAELNLEIKVTERRLS